MICEAIDEEALRVKFVFSFSFLSFPFFPAYHRLVKGRCEGLRDRNRETERERKRERETD